MPANCTRTSGGEYATKHNPPPYYTKLKGCAKFDVPFTKLAGDLSHSTLPAFSLITPNLIDDMHDGTIGDGDKWLKAHVPGILSSKLYREGTTVLIITWLGTTETLLGMKKLGMASKFPTMIKALHL